MAYSCNDDLTAERGIDYYPEFKEQKDDRKRIC